MLKLFHTLNNDLIHNYSVLSVEYGRLQTLYNVTKKDQRNCTFALALAEKIDSSVFRVPFTFSNIWNHLNLTDEFGEHFTLSDFFSQQQSGISVTSFIVIFLAIIDRITASKLAKKYNVPQPTMNKLFCATFFVLVRIIARLIETRIRGNLQNSTDIEQGNQTHQQPQTPNTISRNNTTTIQIPYVEQIPLQHID